MFWLVEAEYGDKARIKHRRIRIEKSPRPVTIYLGMVNCRLSSSRFSTMSRRITLPINVHRLLLYWHHFFSNETVHQNRVDLPAIRNAQTSVNVLQFTCFLKIVTKMQHLLKRLGFLPNECLKSLEPKS